MKILTSFLVNFNYSVSCGLSAAPGRSGTGTNRFRPAPDRSQLAWTGTSLGPVCVGRYRVSNDLCRCLTIYIDRHRPLETRYGPAHTGPRLVLVQASWGRSGAGLNRLVPVGAGLGRLVPMPVPVPLGPGASYAELCLPFKEKGKLLTTKVEV